MTAVAAGPFNPFRSFRDPAGTLLRSGERIFRAVDPDAQNELTEFLATRAAREAMESGALVRTVSVPSQEFPEQTDWPVYEHECVWFPSYPYEWPAEMLHAAGVRTMELGVNTLEEGFGLKDANPYNVLFKGSDAVFVDVLSFEKRNELERVWRAYGQLARTFLLPLLAHRYFGMPLQQVFLGQRDGLEPEALYRMASFGRRLQPLFLNLVTIPRMMGRKEDPTVYHPAPAASKDQAQFIVRRLMERAQQQLNAVAPQNTGNSTWSGYLDSKSLYTAATLAQKERFFREALAIARPSTLLDVGANEGHFSFLAAREGASVVAIDIDPIVVGAIWKRAAAEKLDVLPLVVDLTRPSPAVGWRNQECISFLDRATKRFDMVSMLAVLHHMLVTERVPLEDMLNLADQISKDYLLIEFVSPEDPMFQRIVRGREKLYEKITRESFEAAARPRFDLIRFEKVEGLHRWLYLYRRRTATS
jgi:hypothetical protein